MLLPQGHRALRGLLQAELRRAHRRRECTHTPCRQPFLRLASLGAAQRHRAALLAQAQTCVPSFCRGQQRGHEHAPGAPARGASPLQRREGAGWAVCARGCLLNGGPSPAIPGVTCGRVPCVLVACVCAPQVGSINNTFGIKGVQQYCNFFKSIEDANALRSRVSECFERASLPGLDAEVSVRGACGAGCGHDAKGAPAPARCPAWTPR